MGKRMSRVLSKETLSRDILRVFFVSFLIIFIILIFYAPGLKASFYLVDDYDLVDIPQIRADFDFILLKTLFTKGYHIDFYPLRDISYWIDVHWLGATTSGEDGFVFRLQNIFWFFTALFSSGIILTLLGVRKKLVFAALALIGLNPVHGEMLMWISARKDVMAIAFFLLSTVFLLLLNNASNTASKTKRYTFAYQNLEDYNAGLAKKTFAAGYLSSLTVLTR